MASAPLTVRFRKHRWNLPLPTGVNKRVLRNILHLTLAMPLAGGGLASAAVVAPQVSVEVLADGKPLNIDPAGFQVPASHKSVSFRLGKSVEDSAEGGRRMRFKLDGIDNGWREMPSEMCLMVRFADAGGDQVGQQIFQVSGRSAGWKETIGNSTFTERRETVRVPAGSALLTVAISSSGPPTAIGVYVVQGLRIRRAAGSATESLLEVDSRDRSQAVPEGWTRSGTRPSMAKIVHAGSGDALCIVDDDPNSHAEWNLSRNAAPKVQPGESLTVEWSEMYSIGAGHRFDVNYGRLNAGAYRFWSEEEDIMGAPLTPPRKIAFVVLEPFWKSGWFWISGVVIAGSLLWLGCRAIIQARIRQHLARTEREHLIELERLRIARDLHDDLGARLTHISLVSGLAENDPQSGVARESFQRISGMARDLVAALYQTVWTVNPENDNLEALTNYLCQLTQSLCEAAGLRCRIHSCPVPSERRVTSEIRHNFTLAIKEAVHNAIKHSGATEIAVRMDFTESRLTITIADNGCGFAPASVEPGCGLSNMRRRMESIGGTFFMESTPESGTHVRFEVPIPAASRILFPV